MNARDRYMLSLHYFLRNLSIVHNNHNLLADVYWHFVINPYGISILPEFMFG